MKLNWGGLVEAVQEMDGKIENPYLDSLIGKLCKFEACNSLRQMRKVVDSFSEYDRNYLNSKLLDSLVSTKYSESCLRLVYVGAIMENSSYQGSLQYEETTQKSISKNNERKYNNCSIISMAKKGLLDIIQFIYEKHAKKGNQQPISKKQVDRAFYWAVKNNHTKVVQFFVEKGANIHRGNDQAGYLVCENGNFELVKYFEEKGMEFTDKMLWYAMRNGNTDVARYLIDEKKVSFWTDHLYAAATEGYLEYLQYMLAKYPYTTDNCKRNSECFRFDFHKYPTAESMVPDLITWSLSNNHFEIVKFLAENYFIAWDEIHFTPTIKNLNFLRNEMGILTKHIEKYLLNFRSYYSNNGCNMPTILDYLFEEKLLSIDSDIVQTYMKTCSNRKIIDYMIGKGYKCTHGLETCYTCYTLDSTYFTRLWKAAEQKKRDCYF